MYIRENGTIYFHEWDRPFVAKFGEHTATQMVLAFQAEHRGLPFLYDTHQLAAFLQMNRKRLFDLVKQVDEHYDQVKIVQKNGKMRVLHVPDGALKAVQRQIQRNILMHFLPSPHATAYIRRRTLVDNAAPHVGKKYLLKLDITDFFGSIQFAQVYRSAFCSPYFPKQAGVLLTRLCCWQGALPQGAPTSPALSNLVMKSFDVYLGDWCQKHAIAYTRYCDDMTFSADRPLYIVYQKVQIMLEHMGFSLHEDKTCFVTRASRQCVTGLTVNETVSVSRVYKRQLRQELYYAQKFGLADSLRHTQRREFFTGDTPDVERYRNHLLGQVGFVLQVEPENGWFQHARDALRKNLYEKEPQCHGKD